MDIFFSVVEILDMAEQIERDGVEFYRLASESATDPQNRQILCKLVAAEEEHEKAFHQMKLAVLKQENTTTTFDPNGLAAQYLEEFVEGVVFNIKIEPSELVKRAKTMEDILNNSKISYFALSRPLHSEPDLPNKWEKNPEHKTRCVSCNNCWTENGNVCILDRKKKDLA